MKSTSYFLRLDGLRFYGCLVVLLGHYEMLKKSQGLPNVFSFFTDYGIGQTSVTVFFVISGFLITHLLLEEKKRTNSINVFRFYQRRILRLWPLYFFYLAVVFVLAHLVQTTGNHAVVRSACAQPTEQPWVWYLAHLTNVTYLFPTNTAFTHLWTVSVEEQVYLIWPVVLLLARNLKRWILVLIALMLLLKTLYLLIPYVWNTDELDCYYKPVMRVLAVTRYECILIGAMAAVILHDSNKRLNFLYKKPTRWFALILLASVLPFAQPLSFYAQFIVSVLTGILILHLVTGDADVPPLQNKVVTRIGRLSYGIYVWHFVILAAGLRYAKKIVSADSWGIGLDLLILPVLLLCVYIIAGISYRYIEQPFLRLKKY